MLSGRKWPLSTDGLGHFGGAHPVDCHEANACHGLLGAVLCGQKQWLRGLADTAEVSHCVHYIEVDDDVCRSRLHARNCRADHEFAATDAEFELTTSYFQAPDEDEGLQIEIHRI